MTCVLCGKTLPRPWDLEHPVRCPSCGAIKHPPHLDEEVSDHGDDAKYAAFIDDLIAAGDADA